jgi:hypothetical protein
VKDSKERGECHIKIEWNLRREIKIKDEKMHIEKEKKLGP